VCAGARVAVRFSHARARVLLVFSQDCRRRLPPSRGFQPRARARSEFRCLSALLGLASGSQVPSGMPLQEAEIPGRRRLDPKVAEPEVLCLSGLRQVGIVYLASPSAYNPSFRRVQDRSVPIYGAPSLKNLSVVEIRGGRLNHYTTGTEEIYRSLVGPSKMTCRTKGFKINCNYSALRRQPLPLPARH
jgi:hypothetical protein